MTIRTAINVRERNDRLSKFERVAEAPEGCFDAEKQVAEVFDEAFRELHRALTTGLAPFGLRVDNCDGFREIEAVAYGMLIASNPDATMFASVEGFVDAIDGPARDRVIAGLERDRDFLRSQGIGA